jgi:hypothetical protein
MENEVSSISLAKEKSGFAAISTEKSGFAANATSSIQSGVSCGLGPNGAWEHVQVVTEEMANKLVLNRGAVFVKYSVKKSASGHRAKAERLVWLSGDLKLMWKETTTPTTPASTPASASATASRWASSVPLSSAPFTRTDASSAGGDGGKRRGEGWGRRSIAAADILSVSPVPPPDFGCTDLTPNCCLTIQAKSRTLVLEARDSNERDFWQEQVLRL